MRRETEGAGELSVRVDDLLRVEQVSKTYEMGEVRVEVLRDIDLTVAAGEMLVVVGPSGSGKSTLLNLIGGIDRPTSGELWFERQNLGELTDKELTLYRRREIGFVFQFYNLVPTLTAIENVQVATELCPGSMDPKEALEMVGLGHRMEHFPAQLSGGEQQRVALARGVAKRPKLLLCDEPTGALDLVTGRIVLEELRKLNRDLGVTVVIITHNAPIAKLAHHTLRLGSGHIVEEVRGQTPATVEEISW